MISAGVLKALKSVDKDYLERTGENLLSLLKMDITKRQKRHFELNFDKSDDNKILEQCTSYCCKKLGIEDELEAIDLVKEHIRTGSRVGWDHTNPPNKKSYLYFGASVATVVSALAFSPLLLGITIPLGIASSIEKIRGSAPNYRRDNNLITIGNLAGCDPTELTHEIVHFFHHNGGKYTSTKGVAGVTPIEDLEIEGLAACTGMDMMVEIGKDSINFARMADRKFLVSGYTNIVKALGKSLESIERTLEDRCVGGRESRLIIDNVKHYRLNRTLAIMASLFSDPDVYYTGYALVNSAALEKGEKCAYQQVFRTGLDLR